MIREQHFLGHWPLFPEQRTILIPEREHSKNRFSVHFLRYVICGTLLLRQLRAYKFGMFFTSKAIMQGYTSRITNTLTYRIESIESQNVCR